MSTINLLLDTQYPDEYHSIPLDDYRDHEFNGGCWCCPKQRVQRFKDGYFRFLWFHHAADNRYYYDAENLPLQ